jgi:hypothetical protein
MMSNCATTQFLGSKGWIRAFLYVNVRSYMYRRWGLKPSARRVMFVLAPPSVDAAAAAT